jgi:type VI secretion system secreted protein VgrG
LIDDPAVDLAAIMGEDAALELPSEPVLARVAGIVSGVEQLTSEPSGLSRYRIRVVPRAWLSSRRRDHRIFQRLAVGAIADSVLGAVTDAPQKQLSEAHPEREYTVQYAETDFAFLQRLLAEEGITWFFDHARESRMVLADDSRSALGAAISAPFRPAADTTVFEPHVHAARVVARIESGRVSRNDFDPNKPRLGLAGSVDADAAFGPEAALELYDHHVGEADADDRAKHIAQLIAENLRAEARTVELLSSFAVYAGCEVSLSDHPRESMNASHLVIASETKLRVRDGQVERTHRLTTIPKATPFRASQRPRPVIAGTQTAIVVGAEGEEIDVDEQGRVLVTFLWDRRAQLRGAPTRRVRVSQPWAGPGYGLMVLPRIGEEVVVSFVHGDPDEPLVVGRVHNGASPPPLRLPEEKTCSIWRTRTTPNGETGNHLLFDDQAGKERIEVFATLDLEVHSTRNATRSAGKNSEESVGADQNISVHGNRTLFVSGTHAETVGGGKSENNASYALTSGPIAVSGTTIGTNGSALIADHAPVISQLADASWTATSPQISANAGAQFTATAPVAIVDGAAVAVLKGGAIALVDGASVKIVGQGTIEIGAGAEITISAPTVNVSGSGTVNVNGGTVNLSGGSVNVSGGTVAIN